MQHLDSVVFHQSLAEVVAVKDVVAEEVQTVVMVMDAVIIMAVAVVATVDVADVAAEVHR